MPQPTNLWQLQSTTLGTGTQRWSLAGPSGQALSFESVIRDWRGSEPFRSFWCSSLRDAPFDACAWECPPVTEGSATRDFECVFVRNAVLARVPPDRGAFAEHFRPGCSVVTFANLGGDATLVAPCPADVGGDFSHLASFTRTASAVQQDALWQAVGEATARRIGTRPVWLSTAGGGVAWLHVRLDDRPKYYRHGPYARE
jgi:hypothetical protein